MPSARSWLSSFSNGSSSPFFWGGEGKGVKKREPSECRTCQIGKGDADCIPRVSMDLLSGTYTNSVVAVEAVTLSTRLVQTFTTRTALTETQKKTKHPHNE